MMYHASATTLFPRQRHPVFHTSAYALLLFLAALISACGPAQTGTPGTSTPPAPKATPTSGVPAVTTPLIAYTGHTGPAIGVSWSADGKRIASCGNDGTVQVWEAKTGKMLWNTHLGRFVFAVAWSPDGKTVAGGTDDGSIALLNPANGHRLATYSHQTTFIEGLAWSPDSKLLAAGSQDNTVDVWNVSTGKLLTTYKGHTAPVARVAWSPGGSLVASASYDGTVQVWEAKTGHKLLTYTGNGAPVWEVAWSPDGKHIASGTGAAGSAGPVTAHNSVKVWDATSGQTVLSYTGVNDTTQTYALAWSPDGKRIASGSDDKLVRIWDAASGRTLLEYQGHKDIIFKVAWSPNGALIASASVDGTVQVWSPAI